ncbi:NADP-specific glutamate dehydrogenase [Thermoleophilia bacterium SCSIO 60948]|nr:NADP-specific glutamate dehydrogenase [Thermoleophilia bacterium SCSIO 60948]
MARVEERNPGEPEFHQAVRGVLGDVFGAITEEDQRSEYMRLGVFERLVEPDRQISFRVAWQDDDGQVRVNRAHRVQFNNSLGPYKGGLRFAPSVNPSVLKFLGFEQTFKNALTGLPMGGAKGGADLDPKGLSDDEMMRFCQALMAELHRHIGENVDVPAGDIGVSEREISFLFGQYKRIRNRFTGILTGKGLSFGGSAGRVEATGYGAAYFVEEMLSQAGEEIEGKRCAISGAGNVSIYCAEKLIELGGTVVTLSDSDGTIHDPDGIDESKLAWVKRLKLKRKGRISEYADEYGDSEYLEGETPWAVECDLAFPCATQNELGREDAEKLVANDCLAVVEGANMPIDDDAMELFRSEGVLIGPAKAANAGGVAVSGLEQSQNAQHMYWQPEEVDRQLREIMSRIHLECVERGGGEDAERIDYVRGANLASFHRVSQAMVAYGAV